MVEVTGLHRKSLIRLMRSDLKRKPRQRQRGRTYGSDVDDALRVIAESMDYICAERLRPNLVWLAEHLGFHGELDVPPDCPSLCSSRPNPGVRRTLGLHSNIFNLPDSCGHVDSSP